jgi:hypothetical protein
MIWLALTLPAWLPLAAIMVAGTVKVYRGTEEQ